jgi:hypothetical protein
MRPILVELAKNPAITQAFITQRIYMNYSPSPEYPAACRSETDLSAVVGGGDPVSAGLRGVLSCF